MYPLQQAACSIATHLLLIISSFVMANAAAQTEVFVPLPCLLYAKVRLCSCICTNYKIYSLRYFHNFSSTPCIMTKRVMRQVIPVLLAHASRAWCCRSEKTDKRNSPDLVITSEVADVTLRNWFGIRRSCHLPCLVRSAPAFMESTIHISTSTRNRLSALRVILSVLNAIPRTALEDDPSVTAE